MPKVPGYLSWNMLECRFGFGVCRLPDKWMDLQTERRKKWDERQIICAHDRILKAILYGVLF